MADYSDLIARLEKAEGGDRDLDRDIHMSLGIRLTQCVHNGFPVNAYTSSLDAAIALTEKMLPGWTFSVDATVPDAGIDYELTPRSVSVGGLIRVFKGTAYAVMVGDVSAHARALLIATLKALQSLEQKDAA